MLEKFNNLVFALFFFFYLFIWFSLNEKCWSAAVEIDSSNSEFIKKSNYPDVQIHSLPAATTRKFIRLWSVSAPLSGALSGRSSWSFQSIQDNQDL